jgi:hypothetical protein
VYTTFGVGHYRGLSSLQLADMAPINLISGPNDVGKTALLEALMLHASGPFAGATALQVLQALRSQPAVQLSSAASAPANPWSSFFERMSDDVPITLEGTYKGDHQRITLSNPASGPVSPDLSVNAGGQPIQLMQATLPLEVERGGSVVAYKQRLTVQAQSISPVQGLPNFTVSFNLEPQAAPEQLIHATLVRPLTQIDLAKAYSNLRQRRGSLNLVEALQGIDKRIQGLEVLVIENQPVLHVDIGEKLLLPIALLGDGPVALTRYLMALSELREGILLIDEIDNGFHWSVLPHLWRTLNRAVERASVQLVATTHSRECLGAAAIAFERRPERLRLYRLNAASDAGPGVGTYDHKELKAGLKSNLDLR